VRHVASPRLGRALGLLWFARAAGAAARREGAELVMSFARILDADILRSGGAAHSSYVRTARRWQTPSARIAMRVSPYHRVQMMVEREGFASPRLKRAIAVSNLVRDDLVKTFALPLAKAVTLYNGVDIDRFFPAPDAASRDEIRHEFGLADLLRPAVRGEIRPNSRSHDSQPDPAESPRPMVPDEPAFDVRDSPLEFGALHSRFGELGVRNPRPVVMFAGNGFARKGLRFLLEAWPAVTDAALLIVVGTDQSAPSYERLARRLGIEDRVKFLGRRTDVEHLLRGADVFALPSLFEPFGNVAMEALAAGVPALTTTLCGVAEVMPESLRPYIVNDPTSRVELATRMNALIEAASALGATMRAAAEQFTWARHARELLAIIEASR
jgi:UDP-glucose:(heptosyl)LPS alpha-1,3-glucosyltransferase